MKLVGVVLELSEPQVEEIATLVAERLGNQPPPSEELLSVEEAADLMRCKPRRLYDLCHAGRIDYLKDGRRTLFQRSHLDSYLRSNQ